MSLQGVFPLDNQNKLEWRTVEGKKHREHQLAQDENGFKGVALEPQRMRTFNIAYNQPVAQVKASIAEKENQKKKTGSGLHTFAIKDMIMLNSQKYNY